MFSFGVTNGPYISALSRTARRKPGSCEKSNRAFTASAFRSLPNSKDHDGARCLPLQLGALSPQYQDLLAAGAASPLEEQDATLALDTLLALGSREQVKRLVRAHPELLLMGFELPGACGRGLGWVPRTLTQAAGWPTREAALTGGGRDWGCGLPVLAKLPRIRSSC